MMLARPVRLLDVLDPRARFRSMRDGGRVSRFHAFMHPVLTLREPKP